MEVSIRKLKNRLSQYLKRAQAGEDAVITERRWPVARLTPIEAEEARTEAEVIERIDALPWVRPGAGDKVQGLREGIALPGEGPSAAEIVLQDRD